jgi:hypothetical protein
MKAQAQRRIHGLASLLKRVTFSRRPLDGWTTPPFYGAGRTPRICLLPALVAIIRFYRLPDAKLCGIPFTQILVRGRMSRERAG